MGKALQKSFMAVEVMAELRYLLESTTKVLQSNNFVFWLDRGVLLGGYRHGGLIAGDNDIDLRVMHSEWEQIEQALRDQLPPDLKVTALHHGEAVHEPGQGHPFRWFRNADGVFPIATHEGVVNGVNFHAATALAVNFQDRNWDSKPNLDLYCCRVNQHHDCMPHGLPTPWLEDQKQYLCLPSPKPNSLLIPFDYVFPLRTVSVEGVGFPAPNRAVKYLHHIFGYIGADAVYDEKTSRWIKSPDGEPEVLDC